MRNPLQLLPDLLTHLAHLPMILRELSAIRRGLEFDLQNRYSLGSDFTLLEPDPEELSRLLAERSRFRPYQPSDIIPPSDDRQTRIREVLAAMGDETEQILQEFAQLNPEGAKELQRIWEKQKIRVGLEPEEKWRY